MSSYNKKVTSSYFKKRKPSMAEKVRDSSSGYFGKDKSPKASKVVTKTRLTKEGFAPNKEGLRDFMNKFKYDEDKGYVKRSKALKRVGETKPKTKPKTELKTEPKTKSKITDQPNYTRNKSITDRSSYTVNKRTPTPTVSTKEVEVKKKPAGVQTKSLQGKSSSQVKRVSDINKKTPTSTVSTKPTPSKMSSSNLDTVGLTPLEMAKDMNLTGIEKVKFLNKEGMRRKSMQGTSGGPSKFKKGGVVKTKMKRTNKASKRADGIARKGKTKGRMI